MKDKLHFKFGYFRGIVGVFWLLSFLFCNLFTYDLVFSEEYDFRIKEKSYAKCSERNIMESFASDDYIKAKGITIDNPKFENVREANDEYMNFIGVPDDNFSNYLFSAVKIGRDDLSGYLTCGLNTGDYVSCDPKKIKDRKLDNPKNDTCISTITETINNKTSTRNITTCEDFNKVKDACYPENHICNKYKDDFLRRYYSIVDSKLYSDDTDHTGKFYIYHKNINRDSPNKNCEYDFPSCDLYLVNENPRDTAKGYINVVNASDGGGVRNVNNQNFINVILGGFGDDALFVYGGTCVIGGSACESIMKSPSYYKYKFNNTEVAYYTKNVNYKVCNSYLPNCNQLVKTNSMKTLYNNTRFSNPTQGGNNESARKSFYKTENKIKTYVKEEHLWFADYKQFNGTKCLSMEGTNSSNLKYDIGYCSDLDQNGELKYPSGLDLEYISLSGNKHPNCYLKSCIDLTRDEINKIMEKGIVDRKYCSEYYYLSNKYGFKYFPQDKPVFCSDISGSDLAFTNGLNENKDNCYLKACYSLTYDERLVVIPKKMTNLYNELERMKEETANKINKCNSKYVCVDDGVEVFEGQTIKKQKCTCKAGEDCSECESFGKVLGGKSIYDGFLRPENLYKYCENKILINSRFNDNFDDVNLNVIKCKDLEFKTGYSIPENRKVDTVSLITTYNTSSFGYLCRRDYDAIVNYEYLEEKIEGDNTITLLKKYSGSIRNTILTAKEEDGDDINTSSTTYFDNGSEYYFKLDADSKDYPTLKDLGIANYLNICENVDNNILYYNTSVSKILLGGNLIINDKVKSGIEGQIALNLKNLSGDRDKFLESNVFECKNYKSRINKGGIPKIDCGVYISTDDLGKEMRLTPASAGNFNMSLIQANLMKACKDKMESGKPVNESVSLIVKSPRDNIRNDEYNWLVKPIPIYDSVGAVIGESKSIANNENLPLPTADSNEARGCLTFANYNNDKIAESVDMRLASGIPFNKTNYISTTNFSDPVYKRKKGEKCNEGEISCRNGIITCNDSPTCNSWDCCKASDKISLDNYTINVASRFSESIDDGEGGLKCGFRESNERYRDEVVKIRVKYDKDNEKSNKVPMLSGSASDRFRAKVIMDKILVFRDALVDANSSSSAVIETLNFRKIAKDNKLKYYLEQDIEDNEDEFGNKYEIDDKGNIATDESGQEKTKDYKRGAKGYYTDDTSDGLENYLYALNGLQFVRFDADKYHDIHYTNKAGGYTFWIVVMQQPQICSASVALGGWIGAIAGYDYETMLYTCLAEPLFEMADDQVRRKRDQYLFYLNNSRSHTLDYFDNRKLPDGIKTDSGLVLSANIIDNNNYLYGYYPRHEYIEKDIRNKLESNVDRNGNRYYFNTVLSRDIIRACRLEKLVGDSATAENKEKGIEKGEIIYKDDDNYNYTYYKLNKYGEREDEEGNKNVECAPKEDIKECLAEELVKCLEGYDVSFINYSNKDEKEDDIDDEFVSKNGRHLKKNNNGGDYDKYIPVNIVAYTGNAYSKSQLMERDNCKIDENGNPLGDLSRCRGFEYKKLFYTETQSVPIPLFTHPFLFFKLITPKNTPELFDPTFVLKQFCKFSDYVESGKSYYCKKMTNLADARSVIVDFFNPKFRFSFDYTDDVGDSDLANYLGVKNEYDAEITNENKKSYPYIVQYKSVADAKQGGDGSARSFTYMLDKTYDVEGKGSYVPKVCIYELATIPKKINEENGACLSGFPRVNLDADYVANPGADSCFVIIDNNVACYERNVPFFTNFIFKLDKNSTFYNMPFINVYLRPNNLTYEDVTSAANKENYIMRENDREDLIQIDDSLAGESIEYFSTEDRVASKAVNLKQGFGLSFERSYCSQIYYDYYTKINKLQAEQNKTEGKDETLINRLKNQIGMIEEFIIPDCNKENGEEGEFLINEKEMKSLGTNGADSIEKVIVKKTALVKKYPESYGGFNEICVKDEDIKSIFKYYNKQNTIQKSLPKVFAFKNKSGNGRKTKCLLDDYSRGKKECLIADIVYVHCKDEEKGKNKDCVEKLDIKTLSYSYIKPINCEKLRLETIKDNNINENNIEAIEACYKGGFNQLGTIYKQNGSKEYSCSCVVADDDSLKVDLDYFTAREITPREYGLCVDLIKPEFCPAVKYYDETNTYIDDNLALGLTKEEIEGLEKNPETKNNFRQHRWRTEEKMSGILPPVFFTNTLGHAEFDSSVYCYGDQNKSDEFYKKNCTGGSKIIKGECRGFWRWGENSSTSTPEAICSLRSNGSGKIYEYVLTSDPCERYVCPSIGYVENTRFADEKDLFDNSSVAFTAEEIDYYDNVELTDYKSFIHNEEQTTLSVDKRGASNGYATWKEFESQDYAFIRNGTGCFTGYGPAGTNYAIREGIRNTSDVSFFDSSKSFSSEAQFKNYVFMDNIKKFIDYVSLKKDYIDVNILNGLGSVYYPKRRCNQKGEWMVVEDVYNKNIIDKDVVEKNYYYNNENNFWVKAYLNKDGNNSDYRTDFGGGYCERLICPAINIVRRNSGGSYGKYNKEAKQVYVEEVNTKTIQTSSDGNYTITGDNKKIYDTWNHSGGAEWTNVSAPRNSSNKIGTSGLNFNISQNVYEIFTDPVNEEVDNGFKYLKKVYGRCVTEEGFYNRETKFKSESFDGQLTGLGEAIGGTEVDPRSISFTTEDNGIKPQRVCTSYGLWEGVVDRCFRGCEMMDIYHTNFNIDKVSNKKNFDSKAYYTTTNNNSGGYYYTENDDIISINIANLTKNDREARFKSLNLNADGLDQNLHKIKGFTKGDFLTGGARWARTIVDLSNFKVDKDIKSPKFGLRYTEVDGECDRTYDTSGESKVRQYQPYKNGTKPKRRCYEDGTWGPVYDDTRCVLAKTCKVFNFSLYDLKLMIDAYNNKDSLRKKNELLANTITYNLTSGRNETSTAACNDIQRMIGGCHIYMFDASEGDALTAKSENPLVALEQRETGFANFKSPDKVAFPIVCNMSETTTGEDVTGWSLKLDKIGDYFVPETCVEGDLNYMDNEVYNSAKSNNKYGNSELLNDGLVININEAIGARKTHTRYAKGSNLHYLYDYINKVTRKYFGNLGIENETTKAVSIADKSYESYQMHYVCNNKYAYNYMSTTNGKTTAYGNNPIVLECRGEKVSDKVNFKIRHHKNTQNSTTPGNSPMHSDQCYIKTCGGGNVYQNNWSKSFIKEAKDNFNNNLDFKKKTKTFSGSNRDGVNGTESTISCPAVSNKTGKKDSACKFETDYGCIATAFVIDNSDLSVDPTKVEYYKDYKVKGFVKSLKTTCSFNSNKSSINGTSCSSDNLVSTDLGSYDYQRYGKLELGGLPTKFYKNVEKDKEKLVTLKEATIFGDTSFNSSTQDSSKGFCVPMGCKGTSLGVVKDSNGRITALKEMTDEDIKANNSKSGDQKLNVFNLEDRYYRFGDYVIVQSVPGDFIVASNYGDTYINKKNSSTTIPSENIMAVSKKNGLLGVAIEKNLEDLNNRLKNEGNEEEKKKIEAEKEKVMAEFKANLLNTNPTLITGSICNDGEDVYTNSGNPPPYNFSQFLKMNSNDVDNIMMCFAYLENNTALTRSFTIPSGYTDLGFAYRDRLGREYNYYVKYGENYKIQSAILNIYEKMKIFEPNKESIETRVVDFIVDKLLFDGVNRNPNYIASSQLESNINSRINIAINDARTNAQTYFEDISKNSSGLYCRYDIGKENVVLKYDNSNGYSKYVVPTTSVNSTVSSKVNDYITNTGKNLDTFLSDGNLFVYNGSSDPEGSSLISFAGTPINNRKQTSDCKNETIETIKYEGVVSAEQKYRINCSEGFAFNKTTDKCEKVIEGVKAFSGEEIITKKPIEKPTSPETPSETPKNEGENSTGTGNNGSSKTEENTNTETSDNTGEDNKENEVSGGENENNDGVEGENNTNTETGNDGNNNTENGTSTETGDTGESGNTNVETPSETPKDEGGDSAETGNSSNGGAGDNTNTGSGGNTNEGGGENEGSGEGNEEGNEEKGDEIEYEEVVTINWNSNSECVSKDLFTTTETINNEQVATDENGVKWKKSSEGNCELGIEQEDTELKEDDYVCFYDIDESQQDGKNNGYTSLTDNGFYKVNDRIGDKEINGNIYRSDGSKPNTCVNRDFETEVSKEVNGYYIQDVNVYNNKYKEEYNKAIEALKSKLKQDIKNNPNGDWKDLYDEYYDIYKMEDFLRNNFGNFDIYTSKYADTGIEDGNVIPEIVNVDGRYYFIMLVSQELSSEDEEEKDDFIANGKFIIYDYFSKYNNRLTCANIYLQSTDNNSLVSLVKKYKDTLGSNSCTILTSSEKNEVDNVVDKFYKNYYLNFVPNEIEVVKEEAEKFENNIGECEKIYKKYFTDKDVYNGQGAENNSTFNSGLFLGLQCTDEGWKIVDEGHCKKRCSGETRELGVNPDGTGNFLVKANIKNLRYGLEIEPYVWGRASQFNDKKYSNIHYAKFNAKCDDNGKIILDSYLENRGDGKSLLINFHCNKCKLVGIWSNFYTHTYYEGPRDSVHSCRYVSNEHHWKKGALQKLIYNDGSFDYPTVGASFTIIGRNN